MSELERIAQSDKILKAIRDAQRRLFERKAKLGENVVVADDDGQPLVIPAAEALRLLLDLDNQ